MASVEAIKARVLGDSLEGVLKAARYLKTFHLR